MRKWKGFLYLLKKYMFNQIISDVNGQGQGFLWEIVIGESPTHDLECSGIPHTLENSPSL